MSVPCRFLLVLLTGFSDPAFAGDPLKIATLASPEINESSGLAICRTQRDAVWIHNDSGDQPRLFLVGLDGETKAVIQLRGAEAIDWEDMCSFTMNGQSWLLIGDIGDNNKIRGRTAGTGCRLYLIREPVIPRANGLPTMHWDISAVISFRYEDGPWNCEGLAVDPQRKEILLLTKGLPGECGLFVMPLQQTTGRQNLVARRIASPFIPFVTALDISADGRTMVVCTMLNGLAVFRQPAESWQDAFARPGTAFHLPPRKQGETVCFDDTGHWLYLNSEEKQQPLWRIAAPQPQ